MIISRLPDNQLVGKDADEWAINMRDDLIEKGIDTLDAGTVLIAGFSDNLNIMFETSTRIDLLKIRGVDIIYPIPGSRLPMGQITQSIKEVSESVQDMMATKNICFRDCRLPTEKEYSTYLQVNTV